MSLGAWLKRLPPPGMLALMYLTFIALGAMGLKLPVSLHHPISWSDAVFTSTSAMTVTGLTVVSTGETFTHLGQGIIMALMQMGGLGLMTFAVLLLSALGVPIGIPQRIVLREDLNQTSMRNLTALVSIILRLAIMFEFAAFALLSTAFVPDHGIAQGMWHAGFHAISAWNNAGFSTFTDSLTDYASDPLVTFTVTTLFIVSGLGFVVLAELWQKRAWKPLSLHSKLMLAGTPVLILSAFVLFAALEWRNPGTLGAIEGIWAKLQAAYFQAVTPRTAGFNTIDTTAMRESTALMTIGLMIVGGGSTSTAGGIKVTTAIVLFLATLAFFRRQRQLNAFGRALGAEEVHKVMALTTVSSLILFTGLFLLTLSNPTEFLPLAFEVASAFGTVGLTMGATETLDGLGRTVIVLIMFFGRVGPLALGFFLATQARPRVGYPKGQVYLG